MIRNYYYLIVGLLCILFAVTHTLNGVETSLSILDQAQIEDDTKVAFTYVWHIILLLLGTNVKERISKD